MELKKMARKTLIIFLFLLATGSATAQREFNNWYFGKNCGLTFKGVTPEPLHDAKFYALEGCSSVSDRYGKLLFYTNGTELYNANHQVMKNGDSLKGHTSATQTALIVPRPGNNFEYFVFTVDKHGEPNGLRYSVVDMEKENGLGEVTEKNILVYTPTTEKITAVRHANEIDIWIITHEWRGNAFKCYLLTHEGIMDSVISRRGAYHMGDSLDNTIGCLKASPHGNKIAIAYDSLIQVLDFDNNTGVLSNPVSLVKENTYIAYGLEFSSDGTKLFATNFTWQNSKSSISQFNLLAGNETAVLNSEVVIFEKPDYTFGAIQRGPNDKIYVAQYMSNYIGVINKPNEIGANSDYLNNAINLSPGICQYGLPSYIQTTKNKIIMNVNTPVCRGDSIFLQCSSIDAVGFQWTGPDGFSSTAQNPAIPDATPAMAGRYHAVITYKDGFIDSSDIDLQILDTKFTNLGDAEFEPLAIGGIDSKSIGYKNNSVFDITIDSVYIMGLTGNTFRLTGKPQFPLNLAPGAEFQVTMGYFPVEVREFLDTIVVQIGLPCPGRFAIPIHSVGLTKDLHVWTVDTIGELGQKDFCLPVTAALVSQDSLSFTSKYKIEIRFDALAFLPDKDQPGITEVETGGERILTIEGGPVKFNYRRQKLFDICGTVYIGIKDTTPLIISGFEWEDTLTTIYRHDGSLQIKDFCNSRLMRIQWYTPPQLNVKHNPLDGTVSAALECGTAGSQDFSVWSLSGTKLYEQSWIATEGNTEKEITLPDGDLASGVYLIMLKTPIETVTKKLMIVR